jgi:hypothetical protein
MYQVSAWLMERSGGNSSSNPLQTKATQQASKQAKQSKAKQKQSNWARRPRQYAHSKRKQQNYK